MTDSEQWLKKAQKLFKEVPPGYWFFCADNKIYMMKYGDNGERAVLDHGGMDQDFIVGSISSHEIDGGDW